MSDMSASREDDDRDKVIAVWEAALRAFLHWEATRVRDWAKKYENELSDPGSPLYHDSPIFWITPLLIPKRLADDQRHRWAVFLQSVEMLIRDEQIRTGRSLLDKYDWPSARLRIEGMLQQYGSTLEEARRELDDSRIGLR